MSGFNSTLSDYSTGDLTKGTQHLKVYAFMNKVMYVDCTYCHQFAKREFFRANLEC